MSHTPLKVFSLSIESVFVFFILSGLVVSLPAFNNSRWNWRSFYPRRIARLYLPSIAALIFAYALALIVRDPTLVQSLWLQTQVGGPTVREAFWDFTILAGNFRLNDPLWLIRWEMIFSLLLPLFVLIAFLVRRAWVIALFFLAALIVYGVSFQLDIVTYPAMFAIGVIMAKQFNRLRSLADRIESSRVPSLVWWILTIGSIFLMTSYWIVWPTGSTGGEPNHLFERGLGVVGAAVLVFTVAFWRRAMPFFETRIVQWLGKISFSLYLVHVPIVVTLAYVLHNIDSWIVITLSIVASLVLAQFFYLIVERPSHRFASAIGRWVDDRVGLGASVKSE